MRLALILGAWALAWAAALAWAWETQVGSTFIVVSGTHGIHYADVFGFVVASAWATVVTIAVRPERDHRRG